MLKFLRKKFLSGFIITLVVCALTYVALPTRCPAAEKVGPVKGYLAPDFTLQDLKGNNIELKQVIKKNKITLINFWGIWCPYCVQEIPELVAFYQKYHGQQVEILGVDVGDSSAKLPAFIQENHMAFPVLLDKRNLTSNLYQVQGFPTTFIIDDQGKVRGNLIGATNLEILSENVDTILKKK